MPRIATQNLTVRSRTLRRVAAVSRVVASSFDTRASVRRPSLARERGKYRPWRWRPNGSRRGTAITFAMARAIQPTGEDAWDQFLPKALRGEWTKSFGEDGRAQWSSSAGSDSPHDRAIGGRGLHVGTLGPPPGEQTTKQRWKSFVSDPEMHLIDKGRPEIFQWAGSTKHLVLGSW